MIWINPEDNNGDYAACINCSIEGHTLHYKQDWAITWHMFKHCENPKEFFREVRK